MMKYTVVFFLFVFSCVSLSALDIEEKSIIGKSLKNRDIVLYKFGSGKDIIIIIAGIHGNESNTSKTAYELINLYKENKILLANNKSLWIIPNANPDGLARDRRLNDNDVDLNRNFDTPDWKPKYYFFNILLSCGIRPFSEPETVALKNFFEKINLEIFFPILLSLHSRGNVLLTGNNSSANIKLAKFVEQFSSYKFKDIGYDTRGDLTKWVSRRVKIPSLTVEFNSKTEKETNEIIKIINGLINIDFMSYFYSLNIEEKEDNDYILEKILDDLPEFAKKKITFSSGNYSNFIEHYKNLEKDEELLLLVNKQNTLSPDDIPADLIETKDKIPSTKDSCLLRSIILPDLMDMYNDAKKDKINLITVSGYRSYEKQIKTYEYWVNTVGEEAASKVSAIAGASQHQLGTAIDFNSLENFFGSTPEGKWLLNNSYKYGFILSYPEGCEDITGYRYEPWHYRYIGKSAAYITYNYFDNILELFLKWYWKKIADK